MLSSVAGSAVVTPHGQVPPVETIVGVCVGERAKSEVNSARHQYHEKRKLKSERKYVIRMKKGFRISVSAYVTGMYLTTHLTPARLMRVRRMMTPVATNRSMRAD